ncbi:hypothetical protein [Streptomyces sp. LN245]|uniref:hypothetical protein n=1 Tax=Streptomyces sp. LN245 TaxID=3112975 RepID=UPI00371B8DC0
MEGWKFWWGIAAFFLGGLSTQLTGWLTYRRQQRDKASEVADAARGRRDEFELQHLLEINQLLRDYSHGMVHFIGYSKALSRLEEDSYLEEEMVAAQERMDTADLALSAQMGFILDDQIRRLVRTATMGIDNVTTVALLEDGEPDIAALSEMVTAAFDAISQRVRELYAGKTTT